MKRVGGALVLVSLICLGPAEAQFAPVVVLDCTPCTTLIAATSAATTSIVATSEAVLVAHVTTQMTTAAALIVSAITQSTGQISSNIDKNTSALKELTDAKIAADWKLADTQMQAQLKYNHAVAPGGCKTATFGNALGGSQSFLVNARDAIIRRNREWNEQTKLEDWSPAQTAEYLRGEHLLISAAAEEGEQPTMADITGRANYTDIELSALETYSREITNIKPSPEVSTAGDADDVEGWLRREQAQRNIELAQGAFAEAISRRTPSLDLQEWFSAATGQPTPANLSWVLAWDTEAGRRLHDPKWDADMLLAPPAAVAREQVTIAAERLYLEWASFKELEKIKLLLAASLRKGTADED